MRSNKYFRIIKRIAKPLFYYISNPKKILASESIGITVDGLKHFCVYENHIERSILEKGIWESNETAATKKILKSDWVVFDIGANIGYFTLLMSKLVGKNGYVYCFEPTTYGYNRLKKNIRLNPEFLLHNIVVNKKGLSSCTENKIEALESRFSARLLAHSEKELIEFITLDDYVASKNIQKVDFIKIDVDGYDYEVIKGGCKILKKFRPIVMAEICNRVLNERGVNVVSYLELYLQYGYNSCEILESNELMTILELIRDSRIQSGSWNILLS